MKHLLIAIFLSGMMFGQSASFVNHRFQINNADLFVRGITNFTASGQVARTYIGDLNHPITAKYGSGLSLGVYKAPNALFIQDVTGNVFVPGKFFAGAIHVQAGAYTGGRSVFDVSVTDPGSGPILSVTDSGDMVVQGDDNVCRLCGSVSTRSILASKSVTTGEIDLISDPFGFSGLHFPDGTTQETATSNPLLSSGITLGGISLSAGTCAAGQVSVPGAQPSMVAVASPQSDSGDKFYIKSYVSSAGLVIVKVCAAVAGTPVSTHYNVRVIQ